jgi:hypothetical protein
VPRLLRCREKFETHETENHAFRDELACSSRVAKSNWLIELFEQAFAVGRRGRPVGRGLVSKIGPVKGAQRGRPLVNPNRKSGSAAQVRSSKCAVLAGKSADPEIVYLLGIKLELAESPV